MHARFICSDDKEDRISMTTRLSGTRRRPFWSRSQWLTYLFLQRLHPEEYTVLSFYFRLPMFINTSMFSLLLLYIIYVYIIIYVKFNACIWGAMQHYRQMLRKWYMLNSTIYFFSMGVALMNSRVSDVHLTQKAKVKVRIYSNFINRSSKSKKNEFNSPSAHLV